MTDHHQCDARGHEPDSISMMFVLNSGLGLVFLIVLSMLLTAGLLQMLTRQTGHAQIPASVDSTAQQKGAGLDPDKRLRFHDQRAAEEHVLQSYQWVDAKAGIARIPIRRAIQILAKEGLPGTAKETKE